MRNNDYPLWTGEEIPTADRLPLLPQEDVRHVRVHTAEKPLTLLIGCAVMMHKGVLFTSWAQAPDNVRENGPQEHTRGRRSRDGGATWDPPEVIAAAAGDGTGRNHSHGSFLSTGDELWFFASSYEPDDRCYFGKLKTEAFVLDDLSDSWVSRGFVAEDLYPMDTPTLMPSRNWIMGGLNGAARAAVAISNGPDLSNWRTISLPQVPGGAFGETTVIVGPEEVLALFRPHRHAPQAVLVSVSRDWGENWTTERASNYPIRESKINGGILSNRRMFLAANMGPNRDIMTIGLGEPGELSLNKVWRLRPDLPSEPRFSGPQHNRQWGYPYCHEHEGYLYVVYHHGKEDADLSMIPLERFGE